MNKPGTAARRHETVRCAIYTRKSSEEGLDQEFNSLQAQREACEAFIDGQRYRSLTVIAERITGAHWSGPRFFATGKRARAS